MTQLAILSTAERLRFNQPPRLKKAQRHTAFYISSELQTVLSKLRSPVNRVGMLLQYGYFKSSGRFFPTASFRKRDIAFVCSQLKMKTTDISNYGGAQSLRHRVSILKLLDWKELDNDASTELAVLSAQLVKNHEYPQKVFYRLVDLCWRRQRVIPSYHELTSLITDCFNHMESDLVTRLAVFLTPNHIGQLEELLKPRQGESTHGNSTPLTELKKLNQSLRPKAINQAVRILARFERYFTTLAPAIDQLGLSDRATDYYATWLIKADHQQLTQFTDKHKLYLHLIAFIKDQYYRRQDHALDIFLKTTAAAKHAVTKEMNRQDLAAIEAQREALATLRKAHLSATDVLNSIVLVNRTPRSTPSEKYFKIEILVNDYLESLSPENIDQITQLDNEIDRSAKNQSHFDALESQSIRLQRRVSAIVKAIVFCADTSSQSLIEAIEHFKWMDGKLGTTPPMAFLTSQERRAVRKDGQLHTSLYKILLFIHMQKAIKSGDLNAKYSYKYRAIDDYLIPKTEWKQNRDELLRAAELTAYASCPTVLTNFKERLNDTYAAVNYRINNNTNIFVSVGTDLRCRVRTPATDFETHSFVSTTLSQKGIVPILDVLRDVDRVSKFCKAFRHHSTKHSKMKPTAEILMAGLIGKGCNIGLGRLAKISSGVSVDQLRNTSNWCLTNENLRQANSLIIESTKKLALANHYRHDPNSLHSSSDGKKMKVAVDSLDAVHSYKYYGQEKGVTNYTFIDQRQLLFHSSVFSSSDREAAYVIDGLLDNAVAHSHIHSTDTHGYTEQLFGVSHLLGISFAPRLANIHKQQIYGFSAKQTYRKIGYKLVPSRTIKQHLIQAEWENILRFVATIKTGRVSASQLFKRLSSYAVDHPLYVALKEFGRLAKTQFILTYYDDVEFRQQIQKQLNLVEQANKFSGAVFFDRNRAYQDGSHIEQELASNCKVLLQNAIVLWNYLSLSQRLIETKSRMERSDMIESIQRGSVLSWSHVNLRGEYDFNRVDQITDRFDMKKIQELQIH